MDNNIKLIAIIFAISLLNANVLGLGISSPYWKENPLKLAPGTTKEVSFALTSPAEGKDENAFVSLLEGTEIAEITSGSQYTLSPGTNNQKVNLKIIVPSDAQIGKTYNIILSIKSNPQTQAGNVQLNVGYTVDFPIQIVGEQDVPKESQFTQFVDEKQLTDKEQSMNRISLGITLIIIIVIIILILLVALIYLFRKKHFK